MTDVALRAPASTDTLVLVRLFAGSIGRHLDVPLEVEEDLKLALTEVCSAAIEAAASADEQISVTVSWFDEPLVLSVQVSAPSTFSTSGDAGGGSAGFRGGRARLLDALLTDLRSTDGERGAAFSMPATETRQEP